jgi:hypothetical protein
METRIKFAPIVSHQMIKYGFKPVIAKPSKKRLRVVSCPEPSLLASCRELRICMAPKIISAAPPAVPIASLTVGVFATLRSPRASSMTSVNSIMLWVTENVTPLLVPDLMPWVIVTKNNGPGARAPEALRMITVATKLSRSMSVFFGMLIMNVLYVLFVVLCICDVQKYKNVYYILLHNILWRCRNNKMRATAVFFMFFLLFTAASIAVPIPLFPGNMVSALLEMPVSNYMIYLEALTNGLTYGFITWIVFFVVDKKLENSFINGF